MTDDTPSGDTPSEYAASDEASSASRDPDLGEGHGVALALRRSVDDRIISGVAGGVGHLAGVNPVAVRIGFILLAFVGGTGLGLYFLGWLFLAHQDGSPSILANALRGDSPHRLRSTAGTLLLLVATATSVLLLGSPLLGLLGTVLSDDTVIIVLLAIALIAAGTWLMWRPKASEPPLDRAAPSPPKAPKSPMPMATAAAQTVGAEVPVGSADPPGGDQIPPTGRRRALLAAGARRKPARRRRRPRRERRRRERSFLGPIIVAVLLVVVGGAVMLDRFDVFDTDPTVLVAALVLIVGAALGISSFFGRAHGLIPLGMLLSMVLLVGTAADIRSVWSGIGVERVEATGLEELEDEYRHGIGKLEVDLREIDFSGQSATLDLGLTIGELLVYVPEDVHLELSTHVGAGDLLVGPPRQWEQSEWAPIIEKSGLDIDAATSWNQAETTAGTLHLNLDLGIGLARVIPTHPA